MATPPAISPHGVPGLTSSPCPIYHGRIDYEKIQGCDPNDASCDQPARRANVDLPQRVETLLNQYYEENEDTETLFPILRKYKGEGEGEVDAFIFDIPADWHCSLKTFEKGILRFLRMLEEKTQTRIIGGFINIVEIYGVEDGKKTKFMIRRKPETDKVHLVKSTIDSSKYFAMVKYLKNSTPENLAFYESLIKSSS